MGTRAQKFYLIATDQADTWGTNVKLLHPTDTTGTTNTQIQFGTSTSSQTKTASPHVAANVAGDVRTDYGWALDPTGANGTDSTSSRKRRIPAGTWSFSVSISVPVPAAVTGAISCAPNWGVYRVGASTGFARSLLINASATSQSTTALSGAQTFTFTATFSAPEIILEPGETLHLGLAVTSQQTAGLAGATVTNTQTVNTGTLAFVQTATPGLTDLAIAAYTGAITPTGLHIKRPVKALLASVASAGTAIRLAQRFLAGANTPTGAVLKRANRFLTGAAGVPSATLIRVDKKLAASTITSSATVRPLATKILTGAVASSSTVRRALFRTITGAVASSSFLRKVYGKNVRGYLYGPEGSGGPIAPIKKILSIVFDD